MNLDKQINATREIALKTHSLDVVDNNLLKYGEIYNDIMEEADRIKKMSATVAANPYFLPQNTVVDINELLPYDDSAFVENAYIKILGREAEKEGLDEKLTSLRSGSISKIQILRNMAASEEAQIKGTLLTGFKALEVSEFMQYQEREFVDRAYVLILGRHADPDGLEHYFKQLLTGEISKEEILYSLKNSEEGQKRELVINGLDALYKKRRTKRRLLRIPVIGKCARFGLNLRRVNRRVNTLTLKEYSAERELERVKCEYTELTAQIENLKYQVAESTLRAEECKRQAEEAEERLERLDRQAIESAEHIEKFKRLAAESEKNMQELKKQAAASEERFTHSQERFAELQGFTNQIGSNVKDINSTLEGIGSNVNDINTALGNYDTILGGYVNEDKKTIQTLMAEVFTLKARLNALEQNGVAATAQVQGEAPVPKEAEDAYASIDYFDFENHFRGSREHVKKVQTMYLPYYEGRKNVLDLGCGRGEFTEMLTERNVGVTGVDQYAPYVEYMKTLGLPVVHDDAIHYLNEQEQVDGIFVGQVVEHISVGQILELCRLAYEKLEEGCYLIMETPNPTSLAIYTECFYMDPSHQKPVHPRTLKYIAEKAGFSSVEILYTQASRMPFHIPRLKENDADFKEFNEAMGRVSELLYGSQDYAIVARK